MRNFIRHPADIPIEIRCVGKETFQENPVRNISADGMCIETDIEVKSGTVIDIKIPCYHPAFQAKAKVVWCQKTGAQYNIGVEFVDVHEAFRARLVEQICYIEHYKKEVLEKEGRVLSSKEAAEEWIRKYASNFPDIS